MNPALDTILRNGLLVGAIALLVVELLAIAWVIARKERSQSALAWALAIFFLPGLGLLLLLCFGRGRLPRRVLKRAAANQNLPPRMAASGEPDEGWARLGTVARRLGAAPIRPGNAVEIYADGGCAYDAIRAAIASARHHIHLEEYIFRVDERGGALLDLLVERAREGVEVRLLVDAVGTWHTRKLLRRLRRAGGHGAVFLPLNPFGRLFAPNNRNHRKIIVVDGAIAFFGGMNIGDEYFGLGLRSRYWADSHFSIRGPAVADLQRIFADDWAFATDEELADEVYFPPAEPCGPSRAQIVAAGPEQPVNAARETIFTALAAAQSEILIVSPYLVPDPGLRLAIRNAALRGVHVRILTQGRPPENWLTWLCSRFHWPTWLDHGVRLYEYEKGILHAKAIIVDRSWATIGSANLDNRSLQLNFEVQCQLDDAETVAATLSHFEAELAFGRQISREEFAGRSVWMRGAEALAHLWSPLL